MEQIKFICNTSNNNHLSSLSECIKDADEIIFCVAYWKIEAINHLKEQLNLILASGCNVTVYVSLNEFITIPEALLELYLISLKYKNLLYILCEKSRSIFHPKIYYFRYQDKFTAIVGSANFTEGGFYNNDEASVKVTGSIGDKFHLDMKMYLASIYANKTSIPVTIEKIAIYEKTYNKNRNKRSSIVRKYVEANI